MFLRLKVNQIINLFKRKGIKENKRFFAEKQKITLSIIVRNEENRYLERILNHAILYVDNVVIINDCSTDNTLKICEDILKNTPNKIISTKKSLFHTEHKLRKLQWKETLKSNPNWILSLDADEIFEDKIVQEIKVLISNKDIDVYRFRLYDMWNESQYRDDNLWNAHNKYKPFLIRYQPKFKYRFNKLNHHCGRFPKNILELPFSDSDIKLKHLGWSRLIDRKAKYLRYKKLDPEGKYGNSTQYESILDKTPNLVTFEKKMI